MRPTTPTEALACTPSTLADLGLSLEIRCACSWSQVPPFRLMVRERPHLAHVPLGQICRACGAPARAASRRSGSR
jgi:hypothetical protein